MVAGELDCLTGRGTDGGITASMVSSVVSAAACALARTIYGHGGAAPISELARRSSRPPYTIKMVVETRPRSKAEVHLKQKGSQEPKRAQRKFEKQIPGSLCCKLLRNFCCTLLRRFSLKLSLIEEGHKSSPCGAPRGSAGNSKLELRQ